MASQDRALFYVRTFPEGKNPKVLDITGRVRTFEYLDHTNKADRLTLTVDNHDLSNFDNSIWRKGAALQVSWGYSDNMSETRRCIITEVRGSLDLAIVALEQTAIMHLIKKCRAWKGLTFRQLADRLQAEYAPLLGQQKNSQREEHPLTEADRIVITHAQQAAESDAAFLARLAKKYGATFSTSNTGRIQFHEVNLSKAPVKTITWRGGDGNWENFDVQNNIAGLIGAATHKGIDTATKSRVGHTADNDSTKREGLMPALEVLTMPVGDDGVTHYAMKTVDPTGKNVPASGFGITDVFGGFLSALTGSSSVEHSVANEAGTEHIKAKAESQYKASQRMTVKLSGTLVGDPKVRAKQILQVQGLGKRLSGKYHVVQARHHIDERGKYKVDFVAITDGHGGYGDGSNAPSKADQNKEKPLDSGASKVNTRLVIDERTGVGHYEFQKTREDQ